MTSDSHPPEGGRRPFFDLSGLLESLHRLYLQIGGRLLHRRMQPHNSGATARDAGIEGKLGRRLTDVAALAGEKDSVEPGVEREATTRPPRPEAGSKGGLIGGLRSRLTHGFRRRNTTQSQLHLSEKMQASTWEHINKAQRLARQGKLESARLHASLAENAMKTASRYMGDEEYAVFKTSVEERIRSIKAD